MRAGFRSAERTFWIELQSKIGVLTYARVSKNPNGPAIGLMPRERRIGKANFIEPLLLEIYFRRGFRGIRGQVRQRVAQLLPALAARRSNVLLCEQQTQVVFQAAFDGIRKSDFQNFLSRGAMRGAPQVRTWRC